jgi:hypothetical protein
MNETWAFAIVLWSLVIAFDFVALIFVLSFYYMENYHRVCNFDLANGKRIRIGEEYRDNICVYSRFCWEYKCSCGKTFHSDSWPQLIGWVHYDFYYDGKKMELN